MREYGWMGGRALGGRGGWRVHRRARKLAQAGLIHAATTDAHSPDDLRDAFAGMGGTVESGELVIREQSAGRALSTSLFSRWVAR